MIKVCVRCKMERSLELYSSCKRYPDGKVNTCKICKKELSKNHKPSKDARVRAVKKYEDSEKGKVALKKKYENAKKSGRWYAYVCVQRALKSGKLIRKNICSMCNEIKKTNFHHHSGYSKENRLNVIEICTVCHGIEHRTSEKRGGYQVPL